MLKKLAWKWFDADNTRVVVFRSSITQHQRRETAAHFNDQPWLEVTNHAVGHQGVRTIKKTVVEIKSTLVLQSASLENVYTRSGILENDSAVERAESHRSCQCPRVHSVDSRAFQARIECQESAGRSALASRENHVSPKSEKPLETFRSAQGEGQLPR